MPPANLRPLVVLLLCGLALVACGAAGAQARPAADPGRADAVRRVEIAPDVTLRTRVADPALLRASREFDALDRDASGYLDRDEASADAGLAAGFDGADGNGNGRLDRDEYTARLRH